MNKCPYMIIYWDDFYRNQTEHRINYPSAANALKEAACLTTFSWVRRVEVWNNDFRLLLAVH